MAYLFQRYVVSGWTHQRYRYPLLQIRRLQSLQFSSFVLIHCWLPQIPLLPFPLLVHHHYQAQWVAYLAAWDPRFDDSMVSRSIALSVVMN